MLQYDLYMWGRCSPLDHNITGGTAGKETQTVQIFWHPVGWEGRCDLADRSHVAPVRSCDWKRFLCHGGS